MNRWIKILFVFAIFLVSFLYRYHGLKTNIPFWVDEFSTARNARLILKYGVNVFTTPNIIFENNNFAPNILVASSIKVFGEQEWAARLPFIVIGSLVPVATLILAAELFGTPTGIIAALLTTFSYFMITWSRQARGYVLQQLLVLLTIYTYIKVIRKYSLASMFSLIFLIILGLLTHALYILLIFSLVVHFILLNIKNLKIIFSKRGVVISVFLILLLLVLMYQNLFTVLKLNLGGTNNVWYYHSFLWREYTLLTFLAIIGLFLGLLKNWRSNSLIAIYLLFHLVFINFFYGHYLTKYLLPIFPLLFIYMALTITQLTYHTITSYAPKRFKTDKRVHLILPVIIVLFIILNGDKFVTKSKAYYSLNHDFREISNIDYNRVYDIIKKAPLENTAIIETWPDRAKWYLGNDFPNLYYFRWQDDAGFELGQPKHTTFIYNKQAEKVIPDTENLRFVGKLSDLKRAIKTYPKGFIFIDDSTLPKEIIDYANIHFKKGIYLDHYPLDDNPYSLWPATLYSWGI